MGIKKRFLKYMDDYHLLNDDKMTYNDYLAFTILQKYVYLRNRNIIAGIRNNVICLSLDEISMDKNITDDEIITLVRCGVYYDDDQCSLCMVV